MTRYSDDFRATSVVMLEAAGYPKQKGVLTRVAREIGVSHTILLRWYNRTKNPPPQKLAQVKKEQIVELLKQEVFGALIEMMDARQDADYRDIGVVIGILVDKLQLLTSQPTEIVAHELSDSDRSEQIAEILDAARKRASGQSDSQSRVQ